MTTSKLFVRMNFIEGALNRLLGLACRRGFGITAVDARRGGDGSVYDIILELTGARSITTLQRQIMKLYDVHSVQVMPSNVTAGTENEVAA
jgi:acetolactate synthase regulatory subunit